MQGKSCDQAGWGGQNVLISQQANGENPDNETVVAEYVLILFRLLLPPCRKVPDGEEHFPFSVVRWKPVVVAIRWIRQAMKGAITIDVRMQPGCWLEMHARCVDMPVTRRSFDLGCGIFVADIGG